MSLSFDHGTQRIVVSSPQNSVAVQALLDAIREEEASALGIANDQIASASGKEALDTGVQVGVTLKLLGAWQLQWWAGNYTAKIGGGNLVAESGDPVAYVVGGPQVEITLSAAATIVHSGSGGADIAAIKAKTDQLTFSVSGVVDANIQYVNDVQVTGTGNAGDEWGPV